MVATTFAADTPLAVTGLVAKYGIAGNWVWWNMVMSGSLTTFFFAALWRHSGVLTDVEFVDILRRQRDDATSHADATRAQLYDQLVRVIDSNPA